MSATASGAIIGSGGITTLYDADDYNGCTSFLVRCKSSSASSVDVNVSGLHNTGEYLEIEAGIERIFRLGDGRLQAVTAKGKTGNATIIYGVVAKTE